MEEKERFEIMLEHMDKNIQTVLEGHLSLQGEIERNHEEAKELNRKTNLKLDLHTKTLSEKLDKNREAIEHVDQKVEINREMIEEVGIKLSSNLERYEDHEERIKVLEGIN